MKQTIFLIFTLLCLVFGCNAQIKDIADSPFKNVSLSGILIPVFPLSKAELSKQKKELKKLEKYKCYIPTDYPETVDFDLKVDWYRLPDGRIGTFLTAQIENREIMFEKVNNVSTSKVSIFGHVRPADNKMRGVFEEEIVFSKNEVDDSVSKDKQFYTKGLLLPPGLYRLSFILKDQISGKLGLRTLPLNIPSS